ncbi:MAG: hypothetical protein M1296_06025 [Chloroflexi bacterium]|nr:hypothetical protein [Chloroflexota bacterium]
MIVAGFFITLGLVFGLFAGLMSYLISYEEYRKHFSDGRLAIRRSLQTAFVAAGVFFLLALAGGYMLQRVLS